MSLTAFNRMRRNQIEAEKVDKLETKPIEKEVSQPVVEETSNEVVEQSEVVEEKSVSDTRRRRRS